MRWFISVLIVLALVAGLWWMEQQKQAELTPRPDIDVPEADERPEPRHPLPHLETQPPSATETGSRDEPQDPTQAQAAPEPLPPLPALSESDTTALEALAGLMGEAVVEQWVKPEFVISRTVAAINSLDGPAPALKSRPLATLDTEPVTGTIPGRDDARLWTEANTRRYDSLVGVLESVPPEEAAGLYARYYPLFQQAWEELGENEPYFNDRLIDVIDHLLATPEVDLPFDVVPHEGRLHFAEEALQEESWGRKLLIRMGTDHAGRVKEWLRRLRNTVTEAAGPSSD